MTAGLLTLLLAAALPSIDTGSWPDPPKAASPQDAAVVVGIDRYAFVSHVPYAASDAQAFWSFLIFDRGVPVERVSLLKDDPAALETIEANDAESQSVPIDLGRLSVVYMDVGGKQQDIEAPILTLGQIFSGKSERDMWKNLLAGKTAAARNNPSADAETLGADLACGD